MIPTECPVNRAFTLYISLLVSYISINTLKESTSYFPINELLRINIDNYLEIQADGLTLDLTPNDENEVALFPDLSTKATSPTSLPLPPTLDSDWGI